MRINGAPASVNCTLSAPLAVAASVCGVAGLASSSLWLADESCSLVQAGVGSSIHNQVECIVNQGRRGAYLDSANSYCLAADGSRTYIICCKTSIRLDS